VNVIVWVVVNVIAVMVVVDVGVVVVVVAGGVGGVKGQEMFVGWGVRDDISLLSICGSWLCVDRGWCMTFHA
jgi:hypothetical protein